MAPDQTYLRELVETELRAIRTETSLELRNLTDRMEATARDSAREHAQVRDDLAALAADVAGIGEKVDKLTVDDLRHEGSQQLIVGVRTWIVAGVAVIGGLTGMATGVASLFGG
ncbi:MAG TPA: hypothetical protein VFZ00_01475 [Solirubrobacter sp.]|nr:hypothetical protein [Solirubrobacter sp.]